MSETTQKFSTRWRRIALLLGVLAIPTFCVLLVVFRQVGIISTRQLEIQMFGADGPEWNAEEIAENLKAPLPKNATDLHYSSYRGRAGFIEMSFKAPPAAANAFAAPLCYRVLHEGS